MSPKQTEFRGHEKNHERAWCWYPGIHRWVCGGGVVCQLVVVGGVLVEWCWSSWLSCWSTSTTHAGAGRGQPGWGRTGGRTVTSQHSQSVFSVRDQTAAWPASHSMTAPTSSPNHAASIEVQQVTGGHWRSPQSGKYFTLEFSFRRVKVLKFILQKMDYIYKKHFSQKVSWLLDLFPFSI